MRGIRDGVEVVWDISAVPAGGGLSGERSDRPVLRRRVEASGRPVNADDRRAVRVSSRPTPSETNGGPGWSVYGA